MNRRTIEKILKAKHAELAESIVVRFFGTAEQIHKNYDFLHCTNYWESSTGRLTLHPNALEALLARELVYVGSKYPICSMFRIRKFLDRGFTINAGNMLKIGMQISDLDLTDVSVLQDQLIGVDTQYFTEIIKALQERGGTVTHSYLTEVIDRLF